MSPRGHAGGSFSSPAPASSANGLLHHAGGNSFPQQHARRTTLPPSADALAAAAAEAGDAASSPRQAAPDGWSGGAGVGSTDARVQQAWSARRVGTGAVGLIGGGGALPHGSGQVSPRRGPSQHVQVRLFALIVFAGGGYGEAIPLGLAFGCAAAAEGGERPLRLLWSCRRGDVDRRSGRKGGTFFVE